MKKILFGPPALAPAVSFTACDKTAGSGSATAADSLSTAYGNYVGSMLLSDFSQMENKTKADKEQPVPTIRPTLALPPATESVRVPFVM